MTALEPAWRSRAAAADLQRYGTLLEEFNAREYTMAARLEATLLGLGFRPTDLYIPVQHLSGGQKNGSPGTGAAARA